MEDMQVPPEEFDCQIRNHAPESSSLPADFRERVWRSIRAGQEPPASAGWFESFFYIGISRLRLVAGGSVAMIVLSSALGFWLGKASLPKPESELFPLLTLAPELHLLAP